MELQPTTEKKTGRKTGVRLQSAGKTQAERDRMSLGRIEAFLDEASTGKVTCSRCKKKFSVKQLDSSVLAAIKLRYDKLRPSLQAVEQTVHDERDKLSDADILTALESMLNASPGIAETLAQLCVKADPAILPRLAQPQPVVAADDVRTQH